MASASLGRHRRGLSVGHLTKFFAGSYSQGVLYSPCKRQGIYQKLCHKAHTHTLIQPRKNSVLGLCSIVGEGLRQLSLGVKLKNYLQHELKMAALAARALVSMRLPEAIPSRCIASPWVNC